ncbi:hypothetical protein MTYP_02910 [Methylophilaceae bacterium]|nr:hypothetical protein MTYP_02910 [Methylophilaceae bacterium]
MAYLARLKQLENGKNSHYTPDSELTKPSKAPFGSSGGPGTGYIEKNCSDNNSQQKPETLLDRQQEARRQKVIAMLNAAPDTQRAIYTDTDSDPHNVILTVAVRACQQTCELLIPKAKYDPWRLLELIERHGAQNIH